MDKWKKQLESSHPKKTFHCRALNVHSWYIIFPFFIAPINPLTQFVLKWTHYLNVIHIKCVSTPRKHSVFKANYFPQSASRQRRLWHSHLKRPETLPWWLEKFLAFGFLQLPRFFLQWHFKWGTLGFAVASICTKVSPNKCEKKSLLVPCGWHQFLLTPPPEPCSSNTVVALKAAPSTSSQLDWCTKLFKHPQKTQSPPWKSSWWVDWLNKLAIKPKILTSFLLRYKLPFSFE